MKSLVNLVYNSNDGPSAECFQPEWVIVYENFDLCELKPVNVVYFCFICNNVIQCFLLKRVWYINKTCFLKMSLFQSPAVY